jgi:hypothetical protein
MASGNLDLIFYNSVDYPAPFIYASLGNAGIIKS